MKYLRAELSLFLAGKTFLNSTACFAIFHGNITQHIALNFKKYLKAAAKKQFHEHQLLAKRRLKKKEINQ